MLSTFSRRNGIHEKILDYHAWLQMAVVRPTLKLIGLIVFLVVFFVFYQTALPQKWAADMFAVRSHDFGTVASGSDVVFRFELQNKYVEDVHISHVSSSCGCTSPSIEKQTLKTWETGAIIAKFNTNSFRGPKSATIRVAIDKPFPAEVQLQVKGNIRSDLSFEPGMIQFGEVSQGEKRRASVRIIKRGSANWRISDVKSTFTNVKVGLKEVFRSYNQVQYDMIVELQGEAQPGFLNSELHIITNERGGQKIPINFVGKILPAVSVSPEILALGSVKPDEEVEKKIFVKAKTPFKVLRVETSDPCLVVETNDQEKKTQILTVRFRAGEQAGRHECTAVIHTSLGPMSVAKLTAIATVESGPSE